eukprot:182942-Hanusia_phi.AAC.3
MLWILLNQGDTRSTTRSELLKQIRLRRKLSEGRGSKRSPVNPRDAGRVRSAGPLQALTETKPVATQGPPRRRAARRHDEKEA